MTAALATALIVVALLMAVSGLRTLLDARTLRRLHREADAYHAAMRDL